MTKRFYLGRFYKTDLFYKDTPPSIHPYGNAPWFTGRKDRVPTTYASEGSGFCCKHPDLREMWEAVEDSCKLYLVLDEDGPLMLMSPCVVLDVECLDNNPNQSEYPWEQYIDSRQVAFLEGKGVPKGKRFYLEWEEV